MNATALVTGTNLVSTPTETANSFDYAAEGFSATDTKALTRTAERIYDEGVKYHKMGIERLVAIGKLLHGAHKKFSKKGSGTWGSWLATEANMNRMVANRAIRLFEALDGKDYKDIVASNFNIDAALLAVHEKTPEDVLGACVKLAHKGNRINKHVVEGYLRKDPELLDADDEDLEALNEDVRAEAREDEFVKKCVTFLKRATKGWDEEEVRNADRLLSRAFVTFIDDTRDTSHDEG